MLVQCLNYILFFHLKTYYMVALSSSRFSIHHVYFPFPNLEQILWRRFFFFFSSSYFFPFHKTLLLLNFIPSAVSVLFTPNTLIYGAIKRLPYNLLSSSFYPLRYPKNNYILIPYSFCLFLLLFIKMFVFLLSSLPQ